MQGIIAAIGKKSVSVVVSCNSACGGCAVNKTCSLPSHSARTVVVKTSQAGEYRIGQKVELETDRQSVLLSLTFAFVLPLLAILTALSVAALAGCSETVCAVCGLAVLFPYYAFLHILEPWLQKRVKIKIR